MKAAWWWIDRWRKSTAYTDMSLEARGAYRELLDELWLRGGIIPKDERILGRIVGDSSGWRRVRKEVLSRFIETAEGYRNATHDEVQSESKKRAERQKRYRNNKRNVTLSPSPSPSKHHTSGEDEPPMPQPKEPAWFVAAKAIWKSYFGGENESLYQHLLPLVKEYGEAAMLAGWDRYCADEAAREGGKYASPGAFARKPAAWMKTPSSGVPRHRTAAELEAMELKAAGL